jgi:hypothetical protein
MEQFAFGDTPTVVARSPSQRVSVRGARLLMYEMGDPISAANAAATVRSALPGRVVFTSNNLLVIADDSSPTVRAIRDTLTSLHSRSGRE